MGASTQTIQPSYQMSGTQKDMLNQINSQKPMQLSTTVPQDTQNQITDSLSKILGKTISNVGGQFNVGGTYGSTTSEKAMSDAATDVATQLPGLLTEQLGTINANEINAAKVNQNPLDLAAALVGGGGFMQPDTIQGTTALQDIGGASGGLANLITAFASK